MNDRAIFYLLILGYTSMLASGITENYILGLMGLFLSLTLILAIILTTIGISKDN